MSEKFATPSEEQQKIIDAIVAGKNVVADAVAGSGKTTTVLSLAKRLESKRIMSITYNSALKLEVRQKIEQRGLKNIEIHTFHSLAKKYYDPTLITDDSLRLVINRHKTLIEIPDVFDVIVLDETQDMTRLYFTLINKFLNDYCNSYSNISPSPSPPQFLILGDKYQGVYEFKGADSRYLTLADRIFTNSYETVMLPMHTSYRITNQIARFVNEVMIGHTRIHAVRDGPPVTILCQNTFNIHTPIIQFILRKLREGYKASDFFVLVPSIKNSMFKKLENMLVTYNVQVFVPTGDDSKLDDDVIKNKLIFTTLHQSKGRERKIVIVYGFDMSYFHFFCKNTPTDICPSTLYVAATRAIDELVLIQSNNELPLEFLKLTEDELHSIDSKFIKYIGGQDIPKTIVSLQKRFNLDHINPSSTVEELREYTKIVKIREEKFKRQIVTDLVKFLPDEILNELQELTEQLFIMKTDSEVTIEDAIEIPGKIQTGEELGHELYEDVTDINGIAIVTMWEKHNWNICTIENEIIHAQSEFNIIREKHKKTDPHSKNGKIADELFFLDKIEALTFPIREKSDILKMANIYNGIKQELRFKVAQIKKYDWLNDINLTSAFENMNRDVLKNDIYKNRMQFEIPLQYMAEYEWPEYGNQFFSGRIDADDGENIWEFKCVEFLRLEHQLQLVVYAWIWLKDMLRRCGIRNFMLYNIRTRECQQIRLESIEDFEIIDKIVNLLIMAKQKKQMVTEDDIFIEDCSNIIRDLCVAEKC